MCNGTSYTNFNRTTDAAGQVIFTLPEGDYRFRADKNGTQFWSGASNHCSLPGCSSTQVTTSAPVTVTVEDGAGLPLAGLRVYAFDGTTYTGYNRTTDTAGQALFTLPLGDYRFRADRDGVQYWSGESNHCTLPGCTAVTVLADSGGARAPAGLVQLASLSESASVSAAELEPTTDMVRPSGLAKMIYGPLEQAGELTVTRVMSYTYDPLGRLVDAVYSTGESFEYQYDAAGNREQVTSTTPLSGTVVTTYTYDAANRLTDRVASDGRTYTYPVQALDCVPGRPVMNYWPSGPWATRCEGLNTMRPAA